MRSRSTRLQSLPPSQSLNGSRYRLLFRVKSIPRSLRRRGLPDARTGQERLVFPGSREELVERALRFIAVQQIARTRLTPRVETGQAVTVFFTLSMLRRHLEDLGHGFKLSAIKEALDILSHTSIEIRLPDDGPGSKRRRSIAGTILTNYAGNLLRRILPVKILAPP